MRLTVQCVCGTLLTFSCLFWITADSDEGVLLGDKGFGPCAATLRPDGLCRQGQHESTCPYQFSLPPLTVHLPQQLRELEEIVKDLQKLKDSVDQLREMCADCTVSQTERECGKLRERERLNEGEGGREDERSWMNERGFRQGCATDGVTVEKVEGGGDSETERERDKGVVPETEETAQGGKPQTEGAKGKDRLGQTKVPTAGGNERIVDMARGEDADHNDRARQTDGDKENAKKETSKGNREDESETERDRKTPKAKSKEETEESGRHVWRDETKEAERKTQTEGSDGIKMSEDHDEHTNKEQERRGEERKEEMEKGIKVERNNEKPKQAERVGHTAKGTTIKEGEGGETGREIKTGEGKRESVQRDGDGELSSSKAMERTDFVSISPTPRSNIRLASRPDSMDSDKATIFTSSLPSPPLPSSTLDLITDVGHETTRSTGLRAAAISEQPGPDAESATTTTASTPRGRGRQVTSATTGFSPAGRVRAGAGFQGHVSSTTTTTSTTTPHQNLYMTAFPGATDRKTATKNNSSNIKPGVKPLPGRGPEPGDKHTPGSKPGADQKLKHPRNGHKPDRAPSPDKNTKHNPKQKKPPHHKPDQSAPANVPRRVQLSKPDRRTPPDVLPTHQNPKNNPTSKHDQNRTPHQNKVPIQRPKPHQEAGTPVHRRPPAANTTRPDKYPLINQEHESDDEIPTTDQNSKPEKKLVHVVRTDGPGPKQKPEKRPKSEDETKPQRFELNRNLTPTEPAGYTPDPNQRPPTESRDKLDENPSPEPNQDSTSGQKTTPDRANTPPDQRPKPSQKLPKVNQRPKPGQEPESETSETAGYPPNPNQRPLTESRETPDEYPSPEPNHDSTSGQKTTPDRANRPPDQRPKLSQKIPKVNQKPKPGQEPESETSETAGYPPNPNQKPLTESRDHTDENPSLEPNQDSTSGQKTTPDRANRPPDQRPKPSQKIPKVNQKPKPVQGPDPDSETSETAGFTPNPNQRPLTESRDKLDENPSPEPESNQDSTRGQKTPDRANRPPDQRPKPSQKLPKVNQKPKPGQEPESETSETAGYPPNPNQRPLTESRETPDEYPSPEPNQDSTSGQKTTPDRANRPPDQRPKLSQKIPKVNQKPKPGQEPDSETSETAGFTPKPHQRPPTDPLDKLDENPSPEPESNQDSTRGQKTPDRANRPPDQRPKPSQKPPKVNQKPKPGQEPESETSETAGYPPNPNQRPLTESRDHTDENPSLEPNQDSTSGQKTTPDRANTPPDQRPKLSQKIPKVNQKPKPVQGPDPETSETAGFTPNPNQRPLTESRDHTDEYPSPEPNQDSTRGQKTPDRVNRPPDQRPKPSQKLPKVNQKPKPVQGPDPETSETAGFTPNPNQRPLTESRDHTDEYPSPEPNQDSTRGQKTPDRVNRPPDQRPKPSQKLPKVNQKPKPGQEPESETSETAGYSPNPNQRPLTESRETPDENPSLEPNQGSTSGQKTTPDRANRPPDQRPKPSQKIPKVNQKLKPGQEPKPNQKHPKPVTGVKTKPNVNPKTGQTPQTKQNLKKPRPGQKPNLNPQSVPDEVREAESNKTPKPRPPPRYRPPTRPTVKPGATHVQRPKPALQPKPSPKTKTHLNQSQISWTASGNIQNSQTDTPPTSGAVKQSAEVTHSPRDTEFSPSVRKTITPGPKTSNGLETGPSPHLHSLPEASTMSPNSRIVSDLKPQTASQPPSIPMTTRPNKIPHGILPRVIPSTSPGSTQPNLIPESDSSAQAELHSVEEAAPANPVPSPSPQTTSTLSPDFRSTTPATSGPEPPAAESSTPSARELRVKINQVAAFLNNSLSKNGRPANRHPKEQPEDTQGGSRPDRTDSKLPILIPSKATEVMRDCSDHLLRGETESGVYLVTPDLRSRSFPVFCDMEQDGGGWTLLQRRQDGSVSFNRTWAEYQSGFGELDGGEFWLGNNMIHLLTRDRDMVLRVELEDFDGVAEYAQYGQFRVASERQRYRLTVGGYSGTAGDAFRFSKSYDHNNRAFTTPDRDHDRYPSGNCGAYYSSGWWFDACMAANLNGRYYVGKYKGVRDGIFWGTWHNISTEYYPTNERQSFKSVRMMVRPKGFAP